MFRVEQVIEHRLPQIYAKPWLFKVTSAALKFLLHEKEFQDFEKQYPYVDGPDFVEHALRYFNFSYTVRESEKEHIPSHGRVVLIANHPIGSLDGLALLKMVHQIRPDVKVVANELLMTVSPLKSMVLPVYNMTGNTPKENLENIQYHLKQEGALIIFPAGEVSRLRPTGVKDPKWRGGFLRIAQQAKAPIVPICIQGKNSPLFYGMSILCKPISTLLLVKEMFRHANANITIRIGELIPYESYGKNKLGPSELVLRFKRHLYRVGKDRKGLFETLQPIAHPENRIVLKEAIQRCEHIGHTGDGKEIYLYRYHTSSPILRELGRLREIAFRAVGEGTGQHRDIDAFDAYYEHLILWDKEQLEIAGAYRLGRCQSILKRYGQTGLYTDSLFHFTQNMATYLKDGLELGRSFVQPQYWGQRSLDYLWYGIGAYLRQHPEIRYLFGPVTISNSMPKQAKDLLVYFYQLYFGSLNDLAASKSPYVLDQDIQELLRASFSGQDYRQDFQQLKHLLSNMNVSIPTLYKQYTELCEPGGVRFLAFGVDEDFNDSIDGLALVDVQKIKAKKYQRYIANRENQLLPQSAERLR